MKAKKFAIAISCLLAMVLLITGCKKEKDENIVSDIPSYIELSELNGYTIIRGANEDKDTVLSISDFYWSLKNDYNLDVSLALDEETPVGDKEIIIGSTNRREDKNHRYADFSVEYVDGKILISSGSADGIKAATNWLRSECISDGKLYLDKMPYEYNATYAMEELKICGIPLKDFSVADTDGDADNELYKWIGERAGIRQKSESGYVIKVDGDYSLYLNEVCIKLAEKELILSASACLGDMSTVTKYFKESIDMANNGEINFNGESKTVDLPKAADSIKDIRETKGQSKVVTAVTDKDPLSYRVGDSVVFSCTLYADETVASCPKFSWSASTDDGKSYSGKEDGAHGKLVVKIPATGTGIVRLKVLALDEKGYLISEVEQSTSFKEPAVFSAIVNSNDIVAKAAEPTDFDAFWNTQLSKLDGVAPDVISMTKVNAPKKIQYLDGTTSKVSFDIYSVKIKAPEECGFVSAYLTVPQNAVASSLGITVVFNGYGVSDPTPAVSADYMVLTVSTHSVELGREDSYYGGLSSGELKNYGFNNNESRDTCYFRTMIMRDLQAVRFIKAYGGSQGVVVDGSNKALGLWNGTLRLYGASQGAYQGIAVAAFDKDVTDAQWSIPWMCDVKGTKSEFRPAYTDALRYFDTVFFGKRIESDVNVTITAGLGDYVCPPSGVIALFNQMGGKVHLSFKQGMTHGFTPNNASTTTYKK